jgi:hypothetical protein
MGTAWYVLISIGRPETACGRPARVRRMAGSRQGNAWERNGLCELPFNAAGERQGNGMVCVNPALECE